METFLKVIGVIVLGAITLVALALIWSVIIFWAWNLVMPYLFGLKTISIIQAFAISFLVGLFKNNTTVNTKK